MSTVDTAEAEEIRHGLASQPKAIASKFFYDDEGSRLFQKIMHLPDYYLTRSEYEILREQSGDILEYGGSDEQLDIVELGPGDGLKSIELLQETHARGCLASYLPIDISVHALRQLESRILEWMPNLNIEPAAGDYLEVLDQRNLTHAGRMLILFLGSNIGNFRDDEADVFLSRLHEDMRHGDLLLTGFDLAKSPDTILRAYNDPQGVTAAFNLNLLTRLNREYGASFKREQFRHVAHYDEGRREARSFLESMTKQTVRVDVLDLTINLAAGERIHTEVSRKYTLEDIGRLAAANGFKIQRHFFDSRRYFCCSLWSRG